MGISAIPADDLLDTVSCMLHGEETLGSVSRDLHGEKV